MFMDFLKENWFWRHSPAMSSLFSAFVYVFTEDVSCITEVGPGNDAEDNRSNGKKTSPILVSFSHSLPSFGIYVASMNVSLELWLSFTKLQVSHTYRVSFQHQSAGYLSASIFGKPSLCKLVVFYYHRLSVLSSWASSSLCTRDNNRVRCP